MKSRQRPPHELEYPQNKYERFAGCGAVSGYMNSNCDRGQAETSCDGEHCTSRERLGPTYTFRRNTRQEPQDRSFNFLLTLTLAKLKIQYYTLAWYSTTSGSYSQCHGPSLSAYHPRLNSKRDPLFTKESRVFLFEYSKRLYSDDFTLHPTFDFKFRTPTLLSGIIPSASVLSSPHEPVVFLTHVFQFTCHILYH